jgi:small GTP-binding protein
MADKTVPVRLIKSVFVGDPGVGKSSLIMSYCDRKFHDTYISTIGVDFRLKTFYLLENQIKLQLWDTAGSERFRSLTKNYYRNADIVFLVFDITNKQTFDNLEYWIHEVKTNTFTESTLVLVGNKRDMHEKRKVQTQDAVEFATKNGMQYFEVQSSDPQLLSNAVNECLNILVRREDYVILDLKTEPPKQGRRFHCC